MNKIKLLLPIIGLSTIGATTIPLASCGCSCGTNKAYVTIDKVSVSKYFGEQFTKDDIVVTLHNADGSTKTAAYGEDYKIFEGDNEVTLPCSFTDKTLIGKSINYKIKIVKDESLTANLAINVLNKVANINSEALSTFFTTTKISQNVSVLNNTISFEGVSKVIRTDAYIFAKYGEDTIGSSGPQDIEKDTSYSFSLTIDLEKWYSIPNNATIILNCEGGK